MPSFAFPPARRLRRRGEFQHVFDTGRRAHGRYFTIIAAPGGTGPARLGIVASRKLGNAVARNRAKRLIRNMFRISMAGPSGVDIVVLPKPALLDAAADAITREFKHTLSKCGVSTR